MSVRSILIRIIPVIFLAAARAIAGEPLDPASEDALTKTQQLLNDPSLRQNAIDNPNAKKADRAVSTLSRGDETLKNEIYSLSSVIFERIAKEAGGDVRKMNELMLEAQRNPASFANRYFPPGSPEAARLNELAGKAAVKTPTGQRP